MGSKKLWGTKRDLFDPKNRAYYETALISRYDVGGPCNRVMMDDLLDFAKEGELTPLGWRPDLHYLIDERRKCPQDLPIERVYQTEDCHLCGDERASLWGRGGVPIAYVVNPYLGWQECEQDKLGLQEIEKHAEGLGLILDVSLRTWRCPGDCLRVVAFYPGTLYPKKPLWKSRFDFTPFPWPDESTHRPPNGVHW